MVKPKPTFDQFVSAVKNNFPFGEVTDEQVEQLRTVYGDCTRDDLARAYRAALKNNSFDPLSFIYQQLSKYRPTVRQETDTRGHSYFYGKSVESGTDWDSIMNTIDAKMAAAKREYEVKNGQGSYKKANKRLADDLHWWFARLEGGASVEDKKMQTVGNRISKLEKELGYEAYTL